MRFSVQREYPMARECQICGKGKMGGNTRKLLRAHENITAKRSFKPNLQKIRHDGQRLLACVNCIRNLHKEARVTVAQA